MDKNRFAFSFGTLELSFISSILFGSLLIGISKLLSFILKIYVARIGLEGFGDFYFATSTLTGLVTLAAFGIPMSITRFVSYFRGNNQDNKIPSAITSGMTLVIATSLAAGIALFIFSSPFADAIQAPHAARYFRILSSAIIGAGITLVVRAAFFGLLKVRLAYAAEASEIVLRFVGTIAGMAIFDHAITGALIGYAVGTGLGAVTNIVLMAKTLPQTRYMPQLAPGLLPYAIPVGASEIITAATGILALSLLQAHAGAQEVGLYGAAVSIATLLHIIPQMVFAIFLPIASERHAQNRAVAPVYMKLLGWLAPAVFVPALILFSIRSPLIILLFGQSYQQAESILSILLIAYTVYALLVWPNRQLLDMAGYTRQNFLLTTLRAITIIIFLLFQNTINGAHLAYAISAGWVIEATGSIFLVRQKHLLSR